MENGTIFVTGGNGFIGSRVVRLLAERGYRVRCLLRPFSDTSRIDHVPVERVVGDILMPDTLREGMHGCAGVVHMAGLSNWKDIASERMPAIVEEGTRHVLESARLNGGLRTVFVSTLAAVNGTAAPVIMNETTVYELPDHPDFAYAASKRKAEEMCRRMADDGLPVVIVNPAEVYGPLDFGLVTARNLVDMAKNNPVLICSGGTGIVHVEDAAAGIVAALEKGRSGERYILGGENLTIRELALMTVSILQQRKKVWTLPNGLIRFAARWGKRLGVPLPFEPDVIPYATRYWMMDNTKARVELGVQFRSAEETLRDTLQLLRQERII
ncbi:hypothetical protein SD70_28785 [Gordoniibacillus kamchatkensis]|uniref:NAD-dependent epimerase/dehydratase domain-containing protein n=1 Tax=Gordoniibacillus kamchatkensis TaxID=1590651 RepID=A0ABR5AAI6_9BACL|nr:NAD-dependent epimerase/dehydratase family protein [Paenibacillus sp. VKM B-2647]KIL38069.1 hypothetical protein SD70_28785 [Paenibacillus sp. VKM B-2647]